MDKCPVDADWFAQLCAPEFHQPDNWRWLLQLRGSVDNFASFGCMTSEPFFLVWGLDVSKAKVIEVEEKFISKRIEEMEYLKATIPDAFKGRTIDFIRADMRTINEGVLQSNCFDLAFCSRVLYQVFLDGMKSSQADNESQNFGSAKKEVYKAISQMARITRPGGWVIAVESVATKMGDEPISIDSLFQSAGLCKEQLEGAPEDAYCYKKPRDPLGY
jgi:SAM-dependent methyltransferase